MKERSSGTRVEGLLIRDYRQSDWPRLMEIHDAARADELRYAGLEDAFLPLSIAAEREGLFEYTLRVAELDGRTAAFTAFTEDELAWLYVDPALSRQGIGQALVEDALGQMERPVSIEVLAGNEPALRLYQRCGFQQEKMVSGKMPGNEDFAVTCHVLRLD